MNTKMMKTMDGNEAAAYVSYAFTEVATIYPITPSSPMAEHVDSWAANGKKNIFGQTVRLLELESEAGAAGAMHGALEAGTLATTYTASQGLLLMIPPMYRIAGQLKPGVFHVASRTVGTHAFSIFGDHSDVMSCRQIGCAMLSSASVQEVMDLAGVAHLSAIKGSVPFIHFFDGFRTSHELQKIEVMDYEDLEKLVDQDALKKFRKNALNPEHPVQRSTVQNPDVFFQNREACTPFYTRLPEIVEEYMNEINKITGRNYKLFNYFGAADAEHVIVAMGSVTGVAQEVVESLTAKGEKVGFLQVHLYRPFSLAHFAAALPETVKVLTVLDRTKEPGALGEPLYGDVCSALIETGRTTKVLAGRYGLSSKDVTPAQIIAVFDNMKGAQKNHFTVGIIDDISNSSIEVGAEPDLADASTVSCKFWGLGSDGTVGANKNSIKIIGDHTDKYAQAYFEYDTKKSGGITRSHLRFGDKPIRSSYLVTKNANFVACHNQSYMEKYDIVSEIKPGGTFLLNCTWTPEELDHHLSAEVKRTIANNNIHFYTIDAIKIGKEIGLGNKTNAILQSAFFKLANIIPVDDAVTYMKAAIVKSYGKKGEKVVNMNYAAVDAGLSGLTKIDVPASWKDAKDVDQEAIKKVLPEYVEKLMVPMNALKGDLLPVSVFAGREDGTVPLGTSAFEKRGVAIDVPAWDATKCIQCNQCSYVCPHAAIRPFLLTEEEAANAPASYAVLDANGAGEIKQYKFRMQVDPLDCQGCGVCVTACPAKEKALVMQPLETQLHEQDNWDFSLTLSDKKNPMSKFTVKGSQFEQPLLEFSGACAGCGETPYAKLVTQLFGDRMYVANATGCSSIWGGSAPSMPYTTNKDGHGPAWANSLFEDNAEYGLGMASAVKHMRNGLKDRLENLKAIDASVAGVVDAWVETMNDGEASKEATKALVAALEAYNGADAEAKNIVAYVLENKDQLAKKSQWIFGGDGWAYDIGYGGLDHVLASGKDVNVLVLDTEVYSNTGGQASKSTPVGAVAQFAASGKRVKKKDLGMMAMSYGYVYVAQVAMGADKNQLVKALVEAEKYHGPSLIIAYAPCINHGLKGGMSGAQNEIKRAVEAGYWQMYRFNPELKKEGKNPFTLDSKEPTGNFREFLLSEVRYSSLQRTFPEIAEELFEQTEATAKERLEGYKKLAQG